jgi:RNA polymerase sigma factor (sigma-70 family)|nr:RNA polymerase sigma factor [Kofleriaceae bacterium]
MDNAQVVALAQAGDRAAIDQLVRDTKDLVYNLAVRMLGNPADAEDATQEILLKIVTHLDAFRGDSAFRTWAYRVAANHLLTARKRGAERRADSLEQLGDELLSHLPHGEPAIEDRLLLEEAKLICSSTMLAVLERDLRIAFILGEVLELASDEAAAILEVTPEAFRKRLSRARDRMASFTGKTCGLVDEANPCRCGKQARFAVDAKLVDPTCLVWQGHERRHVAAGRERIAAIDTLGKAIEVFRSHPEYIAPGTLVAGVQRALAGHEF